MGSNLEWAIPQKALSEVAEGPAVRMFERLQYNEIFYDLELIDAAMDHAVDSGILVKSDRDAVKVDASPPTVYVRDAESETRRRKMLVDHGILSMHTAAAEEGYDYEREQGLIEQEKEREGISITGDRPSDFLQ